MDDYNKEHLYNRLDVALQQHEVVAVDDVWMKPEVAVEVVWLKPEVAAVASTWLKDSQNMLQVPEWHRKQLEYCHS